MNLAALVEINNGATVDMSNLTVSGPGPQGVLLNVGILVVAGATANVTDTTVNLIQNPSALGDQTGDDQTHAGPNVGGQREVSAVQWRRALNDR